MAKTNKQTGVHTPNHNLLMESAYYFKMLKQAYLLGDDHCSVNYLHVSHPKYYAVNDNDSSSLLDEQRQNEVIAQDIHSLWKKL